MSAVEKLVLRLQAVSCVDWAAAGRGRLYEEQKGNFTAILSDPAVIAELFAETLTEEECWIVRGAVEDRDVTRHNNRERFDAVPQLRRLLTQEGGGQAGEADSPPHQNSSGEPAALDLPNGKCRHLTRKVMPNHSVVYDACSLPAVTEGYCGKHASDLLLKEESDG